MSKARDQARAEAGMVYRSGRLVSKADLDQSSGACVEDSGGSGVSYHCSKCGRDHRPGTKVYEAHRSYCRDLPESRREHGSE